MTQQSETTVTSARSLFGKDLSMHQCVMSYKGSKQLTWWMRPPCCVTVHRRVDFSRKKKKKTECILFVTAQSCSVTACALDEPLGINFEGLFLNYVPGHWRPLPMTQHLVILKCPIYARFHFMMRGTVKWRAQQAASSARASPGSSLLSLKNYLQVYRCP